MHDILLTLQNYQAGPILLFLGAALVIVDYLFPTDIACQFGYVCLAGAVFLMVNFSVMTSAIIAVAVWIVLLLAHFVFFHRLLDNVPDAQTKDAG